MSYKKNFKVIDSYFIEFLDMYEKVEISIIKSAVVNERSCSLPYDLHTASVLTQGHPTRI